MFIDLNEAAINMIQSFVQCFDRTQVFKRSERYDRRGTFKYGQRSQTSLLSESCPTKAYDHTF